MTVVAKTLYGSTQVPNAETTVYTAPANTRTILDKATVTNTTAGAVTFTAKLVPSGGAAGASNTLISAQSIAAGASFLCPELTGHILNTGDFVSILASAATSLTFRMSGREIS